jgi:aldose sugar dehydrogenase
MQVYTKVQFDQNFGIVTDMESGPDGYLYMVSGDHGTDEGAIYGIVPNTK